MQQNSREKDLVVALKEGAQYALREIFDLYYNELVQYCYRLVRNQIIAEEIVQELFITTWERRAALEIKSSLKAYLLTAVRYRSINYLKNQVPKDQKTTDIEGIDDISIEVDFEKEGEALVSKVQVAIDQLPPKCKAIFTLSREEGFSYKQIAKALDISEKTVENQISIALKKIRTHVKDDPDFRRLLITFWFMSEIPEFLLGDVSYFLDL